MREIGNLEGVICPETIPKSTMITKSDTLLQKKYATVVIYSHWPKSLPTPKLYREGYNAFL